MMQYFIAWRFDDAFTCHGAQTAVLHAANFATQFSLVAALMRVYYLEAI